MDQPTLKKMLSRRLPEQSLHVQSTPGLTPPELAKLGFVCAIVIWQPPTVEVDGTIGIDEGFIRDGISEAIEEKAKKKSNGTTHRPALSLPVG